MYNAESEKIPVQWDLQQKILDLVTEFELKKNKTFKKLIIEQMEGKSKGRSIQIDFTDNNNETEVDI
jgi:hypothetical protein